MKEKSNYSKITGLIFTALLFTLIAMPSSVFAVTAAQTVITNTATVTWSSGPVGGVSASVPVTVQLLAENPTIAFVSATPDPVAQGNTATVTYTLTSNANGLDSYAITSSSVNVDVTAPVINLPANVPVGASMILGVVDTTTITVSGISTNNGLIDGDIVIIGGVSFTITTATDNAVANTSDLLLSAVHGAAVGTPVFEQATFTFTVDTGVLNNLPNNGTHTLTTVATSIADGSKSGSNNTGVVNVAPATITITKAVDNNTPLPGQTITYTIIVENTSALVATTVEIIDPIPSYTTYVALSTVAVGGTITFSNDNQTSWAGGNDATATDIRVQYATLAAGASVTVTFDVTVDP